MSDQKIALVSGSSRGIGKEIARSLADSNYRVYVTARTELDIQKTAKEIGPNAVPFVGDLTQSKTISQLLALIEKQDKGLDLVVANLGSGKSVAGWDVPLDEYRSVFDKNFFGAVDLCTQSAKLMTLAKKGHIVIIGSIAGCESMGAPITYTSAKAGLIAFAKSFSDQVASENIRVNSISPGNILFDGSTWDDKLKQNKNKVNTYIKENVPLNCFGTPEDIAKAVLFLDQNLFINGTNFVIDGGQVRRLL